MGLRMGVLYHVCRGAIRSISGDELREGEREARERRYGRIGREMWG